MKLYTIKGFPDRSIGKESACNAGDPGLIPGSGRSAGEGTGYPLQCSKSIYSSLGVQNKAGQRLTEFCQENALLIAHTLLQKHKR